MMKLQPFGIELPLNYSLKVTSFIDDVFRTTPRASEVIAVPFAFPNNYCNQTALECTLCPEIKFNIYRLIDFVIYFF